MQIVRNSQTVSHAIVSSPFLSESAAGSLTACKSTGNSGTDNPRIVGIATIRNPPPPFIRSTKNRINSNAPTPQRIVRESRFFKDRSGTAVIAPTRSILASVTKNTPSPPPFAIPTISVINTGSIKSPAMMTPALKAAVLSLFA